MKFLVDAQLPRRFCAWLVAAGHDARHTLDLPMANRTTDSAMIDIAEEEERVFYSGGGGDEWLAALEPIGTDVEKPHLTDAPWLVVVFAQRYGVTDDGQRYKNYYVPESVGIATGFLIAALHHAGLVCLEYTPNPMRFLAQLCGRPTFEKPVMIIPVGYPAPHATVPAVAKRKKPLVDVLTVFR